MQISSPKELSDLQTIDLQKFTPPKLFNTLVKINILSQLLRILANL